jgi:hypothetical protein
MLVVFRVHGEGLRVRGGETSNWDLAFPRGNLNGLKFKIYERGSSFSNELVDSAEGRFDT